jgi:uncharacterized protein (DUF2164 family)
MRGKTQVTLSAEARTQAVASIRRYFAEELEQDIGDLKAALLLDYVLVEIGPTIYNQAMSDARRFLEERVADLDALAHPHEFPYWAPTRTRGR